MTIIRCPRCRDEVTVPQEATSRALVRCPLCLEQYLLAEATSNAPPALVIIGGEVRQDAIAPAMLGEEYRLGAPAAMPEYHPGRVAAAAARPALRTSTRPRPRAANPLVLLLNYVGGGLLGLALGLLVLWWGFQRDPLELGPFFTRFTPFLVPTEFQGLTATPSDAAFTPVPTSPTTSSPARRPTKLPPVAEVPTPRDDDATSQEQPLLTQPGLDPAEPAAPPPLAPTIEAPVLTDPTAAPAPTTTAPQSARSVDAASDAIPARPSSGTRELSEPELTSLLPDDWPIRVSESRPERQFFAAAELNDAINQAHSSWQKVESTATDRREALTQLHADLGEIGRLLSYREPGQTGVAEPIERVEKLLDAVTSTDAAKSYFSRLTREQWTDIPDGRGLVALGTVKSTASAGDLYTLQLDLAEGQTLPVALTSNPADLCQTGDQLLVIGRVVEEPKTNLPGYEGQLSKLLASGFAYRPK